MVTRGSAGTRREEVGQAIHQDIRQHQCYSREKGEWLGRSRAGMTVRDLMTLIQIRSINLSRLVWNSSYRHGVHERHARMSLPRCCASCRARYHSKVSPSPRSSPTCRRWGPVNRRRCTERFPCEALLQLKKTEPCEGGPTRRGSWCVSAPQSQVRVMLCHGQTDVPRFARPSEHHTPSALGLNHGYCNVLHHPSQRSGREESQGRHHWLEGGGVGG